MRNTPAQAGFYMPAEWERHEGTWLQWPHDDAHPGAQMWLEHIWLMMTETLRQHEVVHIIYGGLTKLYLDGAQKAKSH